MKCTTSLASLTALGVIAALAIASPVRAAGPEDIVTPSSATPEYKLVQGDKLRIEVYKDPQLSQSVQIRPDGKITLPLVGDIQADGRTPIQLRDFIATQLKAYMTNPVVTVIVVETKPAVAYVTGEVNHPGAVALQDEQITVLQALALAGGLKDFANSKNIRIIRKSGKGNVTSFNYKEAIRGSAPVYIRAGDTVVVPD
ncbi:MAG TPA: polysaccharide biosynthesis/export family protein [Vicinamibacterales bacterium]|nr:polysaccharide biosynthesis/export family protein [Vicinamibacterales bacterium]